MNLEKKLEEYKEELEKVKIVFYKLTGAIESTQLLIDEKKKDKK